MCGICALLLDKNSATSDVTNLVPECISASRLSCRGPDCQGVRELPLGADKVAVFYGSTLCFQGAVTKQPLCDSHGNVLLWNGEIFGGLTVDAEQNDGLALLEKLASCENDSEICSVMGRLQGPWAMVYFKASTRQLWFGRDVFGRRSLLFHAAKDNNDFGLASVALKPWSPWHELPTLGLYRMTLNDPGRPILCYFWAEPLEVTMPAGSLTEPETSEKFCKTAVLGDHELMKIEEGDWRIVPPIAAFNTSCADNNIKAIPEDRQPSLQELADEYLATIAKQLEQVLQRAVHTRTSHQSNLCSDCMRSVRMERSSHRKAASPNCSPTVRLGDSASRHDAECDLRLALATENHGNQTLSTLDSHPQSSTTQNLCPQSSPALWSPADSVSKHEHLNSSTENSMTVPETLRADRHNVLPVRYTQPEFPAACDEPSVGEDPVVVVGSVGERQSACHHAKVAVLFSGGLDSLVLAALADRCVPKDDPIDLLNVAFEERGNARDASGTRNRFSVPDRQTGESGLAELRLINPDREWTFVKIDVTTEELQRIRSDLIRDLVSPLTTVLDDSIGCAIWFAARGRGTVAAGNQRWRDYTSPARVVLVGMGADEQFAGYSRHRVKFKTDGWHGLVAEIKMEIGRISSRNLGRDDRVIADHGREARFPYLDEDVVSFLNQLPLSVKTNLYLPRGVGEKFLLRLVAENLGLKCGALAPKRAIQFGSRIAKSEKRKEKGSDKCDRLAYQ